MATYLADMVIVFEGEPGIKTIANPPMNLLIGMNKFLESLEITFRRDPNNFRPRLDHQSLSKQHFVYCLVPVSYLWSTF